MGLFNLITSLVKRFIFTISMQPGKIIMNISKSPNVSIKPFFSMITMLIN